MTVSPPTSQPTQLRDWHQAHGRPLRNTLLSTLPCRPFSTCNYHHLLHTAISSTGAVAINQPLATAADVLESRYQSPATSSPCRLWTRFRHPPSRRVLTVIVVDPTCALTVAWFRPRHAQIALILVLRSFSTRRPQLGFVGRSEHGAPSPRTSPSARSLSESSYHSLVLLSALSLAHV